MTAARTLVQRRLGNGLRVTIAVQHRAPIVAVNLWYHVGSANERPGRTGFAHLFEHMLFQGSQNVGANEHFELIQRAGGTVNGSTWLDRTNYYETLPSHQLGLALWLEADRMGKLLPAMTQAKLDTQREVVINERRWSMDNQPYGTWWEKLLALAFPDGHPFQHSLMGSVEDLSAASLDDVRDFCATYYVPNNAVLTLVGDVDADEALGQIEECFAGIPAGNAPPALPDMGLPATLGAQVPVVVEDDVAASRVFFASRIPPLGCSEHDCAVVCAAVLGAGNGSRLHRGLVRERKVATSANAFAFDLAKGADLLVVDVTGRPGVALSELESAAAEIIDGLNHEPVSDDEVARAVAMTTTELLTNMESCQHHADKLSQYATYYDDPYRAYEEADRLERISATAVQDLVSTRLGEDNRLSLAFVPRTGTL